MIEFELSMPQPHTHLFEVEMRVPAPPEALELVLPSWTPGSYLIREYARHVQDLEVHDSSGLRLSCRKSSKNVWRVEGEATGDITVRYRVFANELSVRTSHLDSSHGFVNGASVFMFARGLEEEPFRLRVEVPHGWRVATSLHETEAGEYLAEDYHELVDCPLEIGPHRTIAWMQEGVPHRFAVWGETDVDEAGLIADTRQIIDVCSRMFGGLPYGRYLFIVHVVASGRGGLEHRNSSALQIPRSSLSGPEYESLLALIAHEFFHVWLGKRIRPGPLGPFDYTSENYTRDLWVVEGMTTYYTDLILVRAGLMTPERYLERLGDSIARYRALPGRRHQTLEDSSFDAWIRFYRPDEHTPNSQVSYYHKGSLVAMALDLEIRRATRGGSSLDDVLRVLWRRYGERDEGFPEDGPGSVREVAEQVHGSDLSDLFADYVTGVEEIDFERHLEAVGLELVPETGAQAGDGAGFRGAPLAGMLEAAEEGTGEATTESADGWRTAEVSGAERPTPRIEPPAVHETQLGVRLREENGRVLVTHVLEGSTGYAAGVNSGDELVAIDGDRASLVELRRVLERAAAGDEIEFAVFRRGRLLGIRVGVAAPAARLSRIVPVIDANRMAMELRTGWLGRSA